MVEHTATFEIESASDARIVSRALDELHNRFREEDLEVGDGKRGMNEMVEEFRSLHEQIDADSTGTLVVTYTDENPQNDP
ncbi:hypothetical protein [Halostella pelagica]|uniref:hypothetical protein n=1 Tax=Halostella pelagica TaxID=2583824 RepID=UPI001081F2BB|nr:hypothetical protein [Halostella pelagica]